MFWLVIEPPLTTSLQMDDLADSAFGELWPCEALKLYEYTICKAYEYSLQLLHLFYCTFFSEEVNFLKRLACRNVN